MHVLNSKLLRDGKGSRRQAKAAEPPARYMA